jgi:hypothetical protein
VGGGSAGHGGSGGATAGAGGGSAGNAAAGAGGGSAGAGGGSAGAGGGSAGAGGSGAAGRGAAGNGSAGSGGSGGAAGAAVASVVINEIESSAPDGPDWVELTNVSSATVDVSGWIFRDYVDTDTFVIPNGTMVAPGAYVVLDTFAQSSTPGNFDLDSADQARLFKPDGTTLVDSFTWTSHASTTYGRCPNGTGPFVTTVFATKGAANTCPAQP